MEENDPQKLARELERTADELEERSKSLGKEISDVDQDWQSKRQDSRVPGAPPAEDGEHAEDEEHAEGA